MKLYFGRKPRSLLNLDSNPDIKVSGTFKEYYELLNKRLKYLHDILLNFKSKRLAMINKDRAFFQYDSRDLVYTISPPTSQSCTSSWKITIKYVGPVVIYKILDPHNYLLMTLDGRILRRLFEHESLKPANINTSQGNKGAIGKGKGAKPLNKGKGSAVKPTTSTAGTSASHTTNTRVKTKDQPVVTVTMLQDVMGELQAIDQESLDDDHNSEVTQGSELEEEDSEGNVTEIEEQ